MSTVRLVEAPQYWEDEAWKNDNRRSNAKLTDGANVTLRYATRGQGSRRYAVIPAGTNGVIIHARTPRVTGPGGVFANVDVLADGDKYRVRVPHNALTMVHT